MTATLCHCHDSERTLAAVLQTHRQSQHAKHSHERGSTSCLTTAHIDWQVFGKQGIVPAIQRNDSVTACRSNECRRGIVKHQSDSQCWKGHATILHMQVWREQVGPPGYKNQRGCPEVWDELLGACCLVILSHICMIEQPAGDCFIPCVDPDALQYGGLQWQREAVSCFDPVGAPPAGRHTSDHCSDVSMAIASQMPRWAA